MKPVIIIVIVVLALGVVIIFGSVSDQSDVMLLDDGLEMQQHVDRCLGYSGNGDWSRHFICMESFIERYNLGSSDSEKLEQFRKEVFPTEQELQLQEDRERKAQEIRQMSLEQCDEQITSKEIQDCRNQVWSITPIPVETTNSVKETDSSLVDELTKPIITPYFIENIPRDADPSLTMDVVHDAFAEWSRLNPDLKFRQVYSDYDSEITIGWTKELKLDGINIVGQTEWRELLNEDGDTFFYPYIIVDIAEIDCKQKIVYYSATEIKDTIMHEIGHVYDLEHSSDENHLMYDENDGVDNFDTLGLIIPEIMGNENIVFVGTEQKFKEYDRLDAEFENLLRSYGMTLKDWEDSEYINNEILRTKGNAIIDKQEPLSEYINCFADSYDYYETTEYKGYTITKVPQTPSVP